MTARLFIYGTLRKGSRNSRHGMLTRDARFSGRARMRGRLFELGGYPGLVPTSEPDSWVQGELYFLENAPGALARLDDYEGCGPNSARPHEYERVQREAVLESGESELVWVYVYKGVVAGKDEILSGDYCRPDGAPMSDRQKMPGSRQ